MLTNPDLDRLFLASARVSMQERRTNMSDKLEQAIRDLWNIDPSLKPVLYGDAREKAIVAGLHALAGHFGKEIAFTHINARGELAFNLKGAEIGRGGEYGEELATVLSHVPRRTGMSPFSYPASPISNWCWLNHFDAERMLKIVGQDFYDIHGPDLAELEVDGVDSDDPDHGDESFSIRP